VPFVREGVIVNEKIVELRNVLASIIRRSVILSFVGGAIWSVKKIYVEIISCWMERKKG